MESTLLPQNNLANLTSMATTNGAITPTANHGLNAGANSMIGIGYGSDANYDFFDPQHWMLDGLLDFNYNYPQPLEGM